MSDPKAVVTALKRLFKKYRNRRHPLEYQNRYQLLVMTILSAQDSDRHINKIAPEFFKAFPTLSSLVGLSFEHLMPFVRTVRNFGNKIKWILGIANDLKTDEAIPHTLDGLTSLRGIGRKSANVILRESADPAEGIIVDLHVVRVAPRLGLTSSKRPDRIEIDLMDRIPQPYWNDAGMALSFLGRELCRPKNPKCTECILKTVCRYEGKTLTPTKSKRVTKPPRRRVGKS